MMNLRIICVVPGGFEPPLTEPKTVVLPLHHRTIVGAKIVFFSLMHKFCCIILRIYRHCAANNTRFNLTLYDISSILFGVHERKYYLCNIL